jgi:hypothetical protein
MELPRTLAKKVDPINTEKSAFRRDPSTVVDSIAPFGYSGISNSFNALIFSATGSSV